jgi:asparagine synthase (glutamine-hydrolysing)
VDSSKGPTPDLIVRMTRTIAHRGPDDEEVQVRGGVGLGFRRLAIIDVAGGKQPIFDESGDIGVACNGEIYNYRDLRSALASRGHRFRTSSDVETLVHLYEEKGPRLVEDLIGMFAFALVDHRGSSPKVLLGRDRLGIKPLYWAETSEGLWWGSEPKALLASGRFSRELSARALLEYLVQGYVGGDHSSWPGIERLPPGCVLEWSPGFRARVRRYWDLPHEGLQEPASEQELLEWLDRVVADHLVSEVPLGAFLSGGIDSTAVVTSMARASVRPVVACSVGFREKSHDELELARESAARLRAEHHTEVLDPDPALAVETLPWFFDEPHADPSNVPTYLVSRMAREHVTVALTGDGGDEVFGGYRRYVHDQAERAVRARIGAGGSKLAAVVGRLYPKLDWAPRPLRAKTFLENLGQDPARAYWHSVSQLSRVEALALLGEPARELVGDHDPFDAFEEHYRRPEDVDALYRAQYADFHTNLPDRILAKVDRASMAVSLEVRPPLLDHRFVERFAPVPAAQKVREGRGKHCFREALRGRLPAQVLDGAKRGFDTPLAAWVRGPLGPQVREAIEDLPCEWLDREVLRRTLRAHFSGTRDHSRLLWSMLVLDRWRRAHGVRGIAG